MYDVVIVGAGPAGATAARYAAKSGLKVALLDKEPSGRIGDKVCGNALGTGVFAQLGLNPPKSAHYGVVNGIEIISPDRQVTYRLEEEGTSGIMLDRLGFGQYLLQLSIDGGAELHDDFAVTSGIVENGAVAGVKGKTMSDGRTSEFRAKVTIDASGAGAILRRGLGGLVDNELADDETMVCYRRIVKSDAQYPMFSRIYLNQVLCPGGYFWLFPMGEGLINMGVGVARNTLDPREAYQSFARTIPGIEDSKVIHEGGAIVPTRRPMIPSVWNAILFIGDAGFTVDPITGGGIGASMISGKIAAEAVVASSEADGSSIESLWDFCVRYNEIQGRTYAIEDIVRIFLQGLHNEEADFGMKHRLITEDDIKALMSGRRFVITVLDEAARVAQGIAKAELLVRLAKLSIILDKVSKHYLSFPSSPNQLYEWKLKDKELHESAHAELGLDTLRKAMKPSKDS